MDEKKKAYGLELGKCGAGFYGAMIRGRGEQGEKDWLDDARKEVKKAVADGVTFEDIETIFVEISEGQYNFDKDVYAQKLKQLFKEEQDSGHGTLLH